MSRPLCFVLMPFGQKPDAAGKTVNFDAVYRDLIAPGIKAADMTPLRADEEMSGGLIHTPMFERLMLCEYAVADLTTANANVFYELGVRHAFRPWSTVLLFAEGGRLPFDVAPLRAVPYLLDARGRPASVARGRSALARRLRAAKGREKDSPVFQLVNWVPEPQIAHAKTDTFRKEAEYSKRMKDKLEGARKGGVRSLKRVEASLVPISECDAGIVIDLFLSYRAVEAWASMIALVKRMSRPLRETVMVQEQLGLALNRAGRGDRAERVLQDLIARRGPSSETYGILGRVYKDRWERARKRGAWARARGLLTQAIEAYRRGFEADSRDAYPGLNAVTLMELRDPPDPERLRLLPIVAYAVERRIAAGKPDYWDFATRLELAILARNQRAAEAALDQALALVREPWEPKTTARNLRLIRQAREGRGEAVDWAAGLEEALRLVATGRTGKGR